MHVKETGRVRVVSCMGHRQQRRARLCSMNETRSRSRRAYEGEVEQWAVEKELHLCLDQVKAMRGLIFQGAKCENYPNGNLECT